MKIQFEFFLVTFPALFSIVNPVSALGPFLGMTAQDTNDKRVRMARRACLIACLVLCVCAATGSFVFNFFGITIPALKVAGGVLLFLVSIDMIYARPSRARASEEDTAEGAMKDDVAVFPLAIPLLSGPGAIVTVFILSDRAKTTMDTLVVYFSIVLVMFLSFVILSQASRMARFLGQIGINVVSRLMGLILAALAVQFMIDGVLQAFPIMGGS
jgi:multiple antibiotic resistance protein